jgi:enoyl-CoA hydratase
MNSMSVEFWHELPVLIQEIESDAATRVIVLSGDGKHFSSGMDLQVFQTGEHLKTEKSTDRERMRRLIFWLQGCFNVLETCRVPVIAAVQGACIGAALDMITACDLRYATKDAFFKIQEVNLGMMADLGVLQRMLHQIPEGIVRELAYTGESLPAERARSFGFVNAVDDNQEDMMTRVMSVAKSIAEKAPLAITASKEVLNYARDHSVPDSLLHCANIQAALFSNEDLIETMRAKHEKRSSTFPNLPSIRQTL